MISQANQELKQYARANRITIRDIAEFEGVSARTINRRLETEMTPAEKKAHMKSIQGAIKSRIKRDREMISRNSIV